MPILNVRLTLIIFVSLIVSGGGIHLLHGYQVNRHARALKEASDFAEKEDRDLTKAIRLMDSYVRLVPNDRGAEIHLGLLLVEADSYLAAFDKLEEGLRLADKSSPPVPPDVVREARIRLVKDVAFRLIPADKQGIIAAAAKAHLEILLDGAVERNARKAKGEKPTGDPELLDLYAQLLSLDKKDKEACDIYRDAILIKPDRLDSSEHLAYTLLRMKEKTDADAVVDSMIARDKSVDACEKYVSYYVTRAALEADLEKSPRLVDKGIVQAAELLKRAPNDPHGMILVAQCYLSKGYYAKADEASSDFKKAEEYLRIGIKATKNKDKATAYRLLIQTISKLNMPREQYIATLKQALEATRGTPAGREFLWDLAHAQILAGDYAEAAKNIKELREQGYPRPMSDFLDAQIAIQRQDFATAKQLLTTSVIAGLRDLGQRDFQARAYVFLATCWRQEGNETQVEDALKRALEVNPALFEAHAMLAEIEATHGHPDEAAHEYGKVALRGEDVAVKQLRYLILAQTQLEEPKRNWGPIEKSLDDLMANKSPRPELASLKAEVLLAQHKDKDARAVLEECTKERPKNGEAWLTLVQMDIHEAGKESDAAKKLGLWTKAAETIDQAEKNLGDCFAVRIARGNFVLASKDPQAGAALKKLGENLDALKPVEKLLLWNILANIERPGQRLRVVSGLPPQSRTAGTPERPRAQPSLRCAAPLLRKGRPVDMQELDALVADIERLTGQGGGYWHYSRAVRELVQSKNKDPQLLAEARKDLQQAMDARKEWAAPASLAGKICELQDEPDQALEFYTHAIFRLGERDSDVVARTVKLLVPRRRIDEAKILFDLLESRKSALVEEMHQEYVYVKVFRSDIDEAEKLVEKSVAADSKNYKDFAWQGEMYAVLSLRLRDIAKNSADPRRPRLGRTIQQCCAWRTGPYTRCRRPTSSIPRPTKSTLPCRKCSSRSVSPTRPGR